VLPLQWKDTLRNGKCKDISAMMQQIALVRNGIKSLSTWYLTSRAEYEAAGAGIGAAWKETLGRNFPPSTLLYIAGLVDARAKVEIEVTAYVPAA
jgi:enamine deaminase RidA (YjgF/YER057c/UK114 family)